MKRMAHPLGATGSHERPCSTRATTPSCSSTFSMKRTPSSHTCCRCARIPSAAYRRSSSSNLPRDAASASTLPSPATCTTAMPPYAMNSCRFSASVLRERRLHAFRTCVLLPQRVVRSVASASVSNSKCLAFFSNGACWMRFTMAARNSATGMVSWPLTTEISRYQ